MRKLFLLSSLFVTSIGLIGILHLLSKRRNTQNGFVRHVIQNVLSSPTYLDLGFNSFYIAGCDFNHIYLSNYTNAAVVIESTYNLKDTQSIKIDFPENGKIAWRGLKTFVDSPYFYFTENITPALLIKKFDSSTETFFFKTHGANSIIPVNSSNFILRKYDSSLQKNILVKESITPAPLERNTFLLKKQIDGFFCTDGCWCKDNKNHRLVYTYYYRNEFFYMDSNMNLLLDAHTLDTNTYAKISVSTILSEKKKTLSSPPVLVNRRTSTDEDLLYMQSMIKADNEFDESVNQTIIDVYSLKTGFYQYSFYVPYFHRDELSDFYIYSNKLVTVYDHYLVVYNIRK